MSFSLVGASWNLAAFRSYLVKTDLSWCNSVTLHHTGYPDLKMRKQGLLVQHIKNIKSYYRGKGWSAGPHLFLDEHDINPMSPLDARGVHARSFNSHSIGIEVLGNYDHDDPKEGRGWECWKMAAAVTAEILKFKNLDATRETILFHRDDPKTNKSCPGRKVEKIWFIALVKGVMEAKPVEEEPVVEENEHLAGLLWQVEKIREEFSGINEAELERRLGFIEWRARKLSSD